MADPLANHLLPLHGVDLPPERYWACQFPERRPEQGRTTFDMRCDSCLIAAEAALRVSPNFAVKSRDAVTGNGMGEVSLLSFVQGAKRWREAVR